MVQMRNSTLLPLQKYLKKDLLVVAAADGFCLSKLPTL